MQVCLELESYFDMLKIKIMLTAVKRRDVSGNVWHIQAYKHTQRSHKCSGWRFGRRRSAVNPGQDLFSDSASASSSACLSAYLLTEELSLSLSWWISLNGDFPCNHLTLHQISKKPQRALWLHSHNARAERREKGGTIVVWPEQVSAFCVALAQRVSFSHQTWIPLFFSPSAVVPNCHRFRFCLFYKLHPGFIIQAEFWQSQWAGASLFTHLHGVLWRLNFRWNRFLFFLCSPL